MQPTAIGVDIGGTKIAAGVITGSGEVLNPRTVPTPVEQGPEAVLQAVIDQVQALLRDYPAVRAIGIGTAGMVDFERGAIIHANPNLPGWSGMPLGERVQAASGLPVFVDNDVNALAVGEGRFGAGRGFREIIYVAVGTGVGGAIVRGGEIWRGVHFNAGEVAYLVADWDAQGRPVIVEDCTSGLAMERHYQQRTQSAERLPLRQIAERAGAGDELARQVILDAARVLGLVLNPLVGILDPEILIIGGGVPHIGPLWWEAFEQALRDSPMPSVQAVHVAPAALSTNAGLVGAAALALNALDVQSTM